HHHPPPTLPPLPTRPSSDLKTSSKKPPKAAYPFCCKMFFSWSDVSRFSVRAGGPPKQSKEPSAIAPTRSGPPCERWEAVARAGKRHRPRPERGQRTRDHSSLGPFERVAVK